MKTIAKGIDSAASLTTSAIGTQKFQFETKERSYDEDDGDNVVLGPNGISEGNHSRGGQRQSKGQGKADCGAYVSPCKSRMAVGAGT